MKYYCINYSQDLKNVGAFPQVEEANHNSNIWDNPYFIGNLHFEEINFNPIVSNAILNKKSKLTDLINAPITGFSKKLLVSGKLKNILNEYRKTGLQFFVSNIFHKNIRIENYWILNSYEINMEYIDFNNSVIYETENVFKYTNEIKINSIDEFRKIKNEIEVKGYPYGSIIDRIKLKDNVTSDFFTLLHVEGGVKYIVSEKLKKEIEDIGCTGMEFMPIEMKMAEWLQGGEREKVYGKI